MKTCILFPGQGAQSIGMGKDLYDAEPEVRRLFEEASDASSTDLAALIFSGTEDELKQTRNAQLALALIDTAAAAALRNRGVVADGAAGFSLGEWAALCEAGVVPFAEMIRLVAERGRLMDEAGRRSGGSSMSAVLGLEPKAIEAALAAAGVKDAWIANYNAPGQSVLSGTEAGLASAEEAVKAAGAKRAIRLKVSGAFHSPIMRYAYDGFKELLCDVAFADPRIAFYSNVTGGRVDSGEELRSLAAEQIISPVRWIDEEQAILADGYDRLVEAGPGSVLAGLWKSAGSEIGVSPAGTAAQIAALEP
ncbi:MAG: ACP S-malonyltransferase [Spirochaetes bacterium]|nr:ACP S-malonyltransferase [Spirochaetota bacterium]MBU1081574.1 ACP S-malonyltransferase [Spirochaetota bacterium]